MTPKRVLTLIDGLCMADGRAHDHTFDSIYKLAHAFGSSGCRNKHEDWKEFAEEVEKSLLEAGYVPPRRKGSRGASA